MRSIYKVAILLVLGVIANIIYTLLPTTRHVSRTPHGVTFDVDPSKVFEGHYGHPEKLTLAERLLDEEAVYKNKGKIVTNTETENTVKRYAPSGFVDACVKAYSSHYHLVLTPDDVWIQITTSLARYINAGNNSETLRGIFVSHQGKLTLQVSGVGAFYTADYAPLISRFSDLIDNHTKDGIRDWIECGFSTTTPKAKIVSKVVLMGAMKNYFEYKVYLTCGLPKVTLAGTTEDWKEIRKRVDRLKTWNDKKLANWAEVLGFVLDNFVDVFRGKIDVSFWDRIASSTQQGSGSATLQGWLLALIGFDEAGKYILNDFDTIKRTDVYGRMLISDAPVSAVEVPVTIDDNGVQHDTIFYAGAIMSTFDPETQEMGVALDWALIDITKN